MNNKIKWLVIGCLAGVVEISWSDTNFPCTTPDEWHRVADPYNQMIFSCDIAVGSGVISTLCTEGADPTSSYSTVFWYDMAWDKFKGSGEATPQSCASNFTTYANNNPDKYALLKQSCTNAKNWSSSGTDEFTCDNNNNPRSCFPNQTYGLLHGRVMMTNADSTSYPCGGFRVTAENCATCFANAPK